MMELEQEQIRQLLRRTMQPMADQDGGELQRDLWPRMLKRLEAHHAKVPWFDWALLAAVAMLLALSPRAIPLFLYYF